MKALQIAFKDLTVLFRDRTALLLMLGAPLILTVGLALVSGRMSGSSGPAFQNLPVAVVNLDRGEIGKQLIHDVRCPGPKGGPGAFLEYLNEVHFTHTECLLLSLDSRAGRPST